MNFKPTLSKVIAAFAFTLILFWIPLFFIKELPKIAEIVNLSEILSPINIIIFIVEFILLYIFFSLFHKKEKKLVIMKEDTFKKMMQNPQAPMK